MTQLLYLEAEFNMLQGPIPEDLGNATNMIEINLNENFLSSTIPSSLGQLSNLYLLALTYNSLTGTIPSLEGLTSISSLQLSENYLTGSLPSSVVSLSTLTGLSIADNHLTSSLSQEPWEQLKNIRTLFLYSNHFSGTIPSQLSALGVYTLEISLHSCMLSGSIPSELSLLSHLASLDLHLNYLSGSLPSSLEVLDHMTTLYLDNNLLSGTLSPGLLDGQSLYSLFLYQNHFSGRILLPSSAPPLLSNFIAFNNKFSGPVPTQLFVLPLIEVLSLSLNCFSGTLPPCSLSTSLSDTSPLSHSSSYSPTLKALDLSDLSSGPGCRHYPFPVLPNSGFLSFQSLGSFPSCVLDLPLLDTLYLAGNGLTGQIVISSKWSCERTSLRSLILAQNQLTGSIPSALQTCGSVSYLDLALNRLSGTLESNLGSSKKSSNPNTNAFLSLSVNRLSGPLPLNENLTRQGVSSLVTSILQGNMFSFSNVKFDRSLSSSSASTQASLYNGSSNLNTSLYFSLAIFFMLVCVAMGLIYFDNSQIDNKHKAQQNNNNNNNNNNNHILKLCLRLIFSPTEPLEHNLFIGRWLSSRHTILTSILYLSFLSVLLLMMKLLPVYAIQFSTQRFQYAWVLSASFLHGWLPCLLLGIFVVIAVLMVHRETLTSKLSLSPQTQHLESIKTFRMTATQPLPDPHPHPSNIFSCLSFSLLVFNACFMLFLNGLYLIVLLPLNSNASLFQILLGVVKCIWNACLSALSRRWFPHSLTHRLWFGLFFRVFNLVIATYLSGVLTESSCIYPLFVSHPINSFSFQIKTCSSILIHNESIHCLKFGESTISLPPTDPPFIYHFQCASSLIINYTPVMVYSLLISLLWNCFQIASILIAEGIHLEISSLSVFLLVPDHTMISVSTLIQLMVNLTLLLTYGLACPYLGFILILLSKFQLFNYQFFSELPKTLQSKGEEATRESIELIGITHMNHEPNMETQNEFTNQPTNINAIDRTSIVSIESTSTIPSPSTSPSGSFPSTQPFLYDLKEAFNSILPRFLILLSLVVGGFWSLQFFDMVGDVYGISLGLGVSLLFYGAISGLSSLMVASICIKKK